MEDELTDPHARVRQALLEERDEPWVQEHLREGCEDCMHFATTLGIVDDFAGSLAAAPTSVDNLLPNGLTARDVADALEKHGFLDESIPWRDQANREEREGASRRRVRRPGGRTNHGMRRSHQQVPTSSAGPIPGVSSSAVRSRPEAAQITMLIGLGRDARQVISSSGLLKGHLGVGHVHLTTDASPSPDDSTVVIWPEPASDPEDRSTTGPVLRAGLRDHERVYARIGQEVHTLLAHSNDRGEAVREVRLFVVACIGEPGGAGLLLPVLLVAQRLRKDLGNVGLSVCRYLVLVQSDHPRADAALVALQAAAHGAHLGGARLEAPFAESVVVVEQPRPARPNARRQVRYAGHLLRVIADQGSLGDAVRARLRQVDGHGVFRLMGVAAIVAPEQAISAWLASIAVDLDARARGEREETGECWLTDWQVAQLLGLDHLQAELDAVGAPLERWLDELPDEPDRDAIKTSGDSLATAFLQMSDQVATAVSNTKARWTEVLDHVFVTQDLAGGRLFGTAGYERVRTALSAGARNSASDGAGLGELMRMASFLEEPIDPFESVRGPSGIASLRPRVLLTYLAAVAGGGVAASIAFDYDLHPSRWSAVAVSMLSGTSTMSVPLLVILAVLSVALPLAAALWHRRGWHGRRARRLRARVREWVTTRVRHEVDEAVQALRSWLDRELTLRIAQRRAQSAGYRALALRDAEPPDGGIDLAQSGAGGLHLAGTEWEEMARRLGPARPGGLLEDFARQSASQPGRARALVGASAEDVHRSLMGWLESTIGRELSSGGRVPQALAAVPAGTWRRCGRSLLERATPAPDPRRGGAREFAYIASVPSNGDLAFHLGGPLSSAIELDEVVESAFAGRFDLVAIGTRTLDALDVIARTSGTAHTFALPPHDVLTELLALERGPGRTHAPLPDSTVALPRRVFLSHTSELREIPADRSYVSAAEAAVMRAGHAVTDMAYFTAGDVTPAHRVSAMVAKAQVYVGIIGLSYGTPVHGRPDLSFTELEFEAATSLGLPRLVFLIHDEALPEPGEPPDLISRQRAFRRRLLDDADVTVALVSEPADLRIGLYQALIELGQKRMHKLPRGGRSGIHAAGVRDRTASS